MDILSVDKINEISRLLQKREQTIAVAESCTAGLIQNAFSQANNATSFFQGGITAYNLGQKTKHLRVNPVFAESCNSVGQEVSNRMAMEVALAFNAEMGLAITGYAKPVPSLSIEDCYAYISIVEYPNILLEKRIKGDPTRSLFENQRLFTEKMMDNLLQILKGK